MAQRPGIRIAPETAATARNLLKRREHLAQEDDGAGHADERIAGQLAGVNDALAMLWAGVLERDTAG